MNTMKKLTGADWPMDQKTKKELVAKRRERRDKLLSKPENRQIYNALGKSYEVAELLHKAREETRLTQQQLAKKLHTSQSNLARIEQGQNITLTTLFEYAKACGKKVCIQLS
ncbi:MAG: helix-turn-helix transcriptional regulator [Victivallales bacterium]